MFEYYYKADGCRAIDARSSDCICWHPEGSGPMADERHDSETQLVEWREALPPSNA